MEKKPAQIPLLFMLLIAVLAWFGVIMQFYLSTTTWSGLGLSSAEGTTRFFSYFTILTNIIIAISVTVSLLRPRSSAGNFFLKSSTQTAIAMYIFVVGVTYNTLLYNLWKPEGLQLVVDNLLHRIVPVLYLIYWLVFVTKGKIKNNNTYKWLIYPAIYFVWVLIFGAMTKFYPYPFIDVNVLGYPKMFMNAGILLIVFLMLGFIAIAVKKNVGKKIS
jgi:hypothetical protein